MLDCLICLIEDEGCVTVGELAKGGTNGFGLIIVGPPGSIEMSQWWRHVPHSPLERPRSGSARFGPELSSIRRRMPISTTTAPPILRVCGPEESRLVGARRSIHRLHRRSALGLSTRRSTLRTRSQWIVRRLAVTYAVT
jgi:hypothetical protein